MATIDLDDATFRVVRNAVQMALREIRSLHRQCADRYVVHVHHERYCDAEHTAEMRDLAADTARTYELALNMLDTQHAATPASTGTTTLSRTGPLVFAARLTATVQVSGRSLAEAVDALHAIQAYTPAPPLRLFDGIVISRLSLGPATANTLTYLPNDAPAVDVTGMHQPRCCPTCASVYEQTNSDTGHCPRCTDQPTPAT
jgi:hypothetical protein